MQNTETGGAGTGAEDDDSEGAPGRIGADSEVVRKLEELLHLDSTSEQPGQNGENFAPENPLAPGILPELVQRVLDQYDRLKSQNKVISKVWTVPKSGTSIKYLAAKWKFRKILHENGRKLPGKAWGEDPNDLKTFDEVIGED